MSGSTRRCATCSRPNCSPTSQIAGADTGNLVIQVRENPVINRIVLEGNRRIKDDKITPEIRLAPRQIFTRSPARADVARIIELYRRQGRFAATVEPKIVQLDQNRVDVVFEINEGPQVARPPDQHHRQRAVRRRPPDQRDGDPRARLVQYLQLARHLRSGPAGLRPAEAAAFYLTQGYADFRVVSAVAELTPDRRDFIITYVVEEGRALQVRRRRRRERHPRLQPGAASRQPADARPATGTTPSWSRTRSPG